MDVFYNKLEADPSTIGMDVVGGRLDLVSATSIWWSFLNSNQIRLVNPDTGRWELVKCSAEPTLANNADDMNGTDLAVDKIYDIFAEYSSATEFTLVASRWQTATAGTSARTIAWAGSTAYKIGDRVSNSSHYYCCIDDHTSHSTTFSNDSAYWVDNGVAADVGSSDFYGLYRHDGVLVSDSSTTGKSRRWLGIIYTYNNGGTVNFKDDVNYRYIANHYNRRIKYIVSTNSTWSWSYTGGWREFNGGLGQTRGMFLAPTTSDSYVGTCQATVVGTNPGISMGINQTTAQPAMIGYLQSSNSAPATTNMYFIPALGLNYMTCLESLGANGAMWCGNAGGAVSQILV